jgi:hypothetical protein
MLALLLSDFEKRLSPDLPALGAVPNSPVHRPLTMLSRINRLSLLSHVRRSQGTELEEKLTDWLLGGGPQPNEWRRPIHDDGVTLLQKIGCAGFTRVINAYLRAGTQWGRLSGLNLAFKRPDAETIGLLGAISQHGDPCGDHIHEQTLALEALAYLGHWEDVIRGVMRSGLRVRSQLSRAFLSRPPLDEAALAPAIAEVSADDVPSSGSVLVLGLSRWCGAIERVRAALASAPVDSELALSCVITLGLCGDASPETISLIIKQLDVESHRWQAKIALLRIGAPPAIDALLADLRKQFDLGLAIDLYQRRESRERSLEIIKARLASVSGHEMEELLGHLLKLSDDLAAPFLEDVRVRDLLRDRSFADEGSGWWITGSKASAIRGLARFDRERAILAAQKALENPGAHDREYYSYLLIELAGERAVKPLLDQAMVEKSTSVIWAIAQAFDEAGHKDVLAELLQGRDPTQRLTGARLAEKMRVPDTDVAMLESLAADPDDTVVTSATRALSFQRAARNAAELMAALRAEQDVGRRWILIDALLASGDPGDDHGPFPRRVNELFGSSPCLEREYVSEKMRERRRRLQEEATKRDKK